MPILGFIKLMLEKYKTVDTPQSALAKACNYALERWDGLCRYCEEGYYEIDNSAVERSIRPLTLGRLCATEHNLPYVPLTIMLAS